MVYLRLSTKSTDSISVEINLLPIIGNEIFDSKVSKSMVDLQFPAFATTCILSKGQNFGDASPSRPQVPRFDYVYTSGSVQVPARGAGRHGTRHMCFLAAKLIFFYNYVANFGVAVSN